MTRSVPYYGGLASLRPPAFWAAGASKYKMQLQLIALELRNNETNLNKSISTQNLYDSFSSTDRQSRNVFFVISISFSNILLQLLTFNPKMTTFFVRSQRAHLRRPIGISPSPPQISRNKARPMLLVILHPKVSPNARISHCRNRAAPKTEAKRPPGSDLAA